MGNKNTVTLSTEEYLRLCEIEKRYEHCNEEYKKQCKKNKDFYDKLK